MAFFNRQAFGRGCQWQVLQILKYSILFQKNAYLKGFNAILIGRNARQVFNKKQYKGIALKCQKQYNIIGKKFGFTFDTRIRKNPI